MKKSLIGAIVFVSFISAAPETHATTTESAVREYFIDTPVMIEIARCESNFRQFTDSGAVLRGGSGSGMVGVFQFFESIHKSSALALGHDILTLEGNLAYAKHLYETEGAMPWNSARSCWENTTTATNIQQEATTLDVLKQKLALLQQLLSLLKEIQSLKSNS